MNAVFKEKKNHFFLAGHQIKSLIIKLNVLALLVKKTNKKTKNKCEIKPQLYLKKKMCVRSFPLIVFSPYIYINTFWTPFGIFKMFW